MNISDMISNIPEETLISLAVFIGAGIIYVMRKFGSLSQTIREYEQADKSAVQMRDDHALLLNEIEQRERLKFSNSHNDVESQLVEHEMIGFKMAPKFQELSKEITDILDEQSDSIIDVSRNIESIASKISKSFAVESNSSLEQINNMIPQLIAKIEAVNNSVKSESQKITALLNEIYMIKRTIGVE